MSYIIIILSQMYTNKDFLLHIMIGLHHVMKLPLHVMKLPLHIMILKLHIMVLSHITYHEVTPSVTSRNAPSR